MSASGVFFVAISFHYALLVLRVEGDYIPKNTKQSRVRGLYTSYIYVKLNSALEESDMKTVHENPRFQIACSADSVEVTNKNDGNVIAIDLNEVGQMMLYQLGRKEREMVLSTHPAHADCPVIVIKGKQ
jgi:hypothetical protein